jgi:hypothetical protein
MSCDDRRDENQSLSTGKSQMSENNMNTINQPSSPTRKFSSELPKLSDPYWLRNLSNVLNLLSDRHFVLARMVDDVNSRMQHRNAVEHDSVRKSARKKLKRMEAALDRLRGRLAAQRLTVARALMTLDLAYGELGYSERYFARSDSVSICKLVSDSADATKALYWIGSVGAQIEEKLSIFAEIQRILQRLKESFARGKTEIEHSDRHQLQSALFEWLQFCWSAGQAVDIRDLDARCIEARQFLARFAAIESQIQHEAGRSDL